MSKKLFLLSVSLLLIVAISARATSGDTAAKPQLIASLDTGRIQLGSVKAAIADVNSGDILYAKHSDWVTPIASITKLMTAMVVLDSDQSLNEWVTIPEPDRDTRKNAYSRIRIGSQLKRADLLRLALMSSENLAAYTLADSYTGGKEAFVADMNRKAAALGMKNSHFVDASGLSTGNVSTAGDLVKMVRAAAQYEKIRKYSTTPNFTARFKKPRYSLAYGNTNRLVHRKSWDIELSKTGYLTEAGRCLVLLSEFEGNEIAIVLLDAFGKMTPLGDAGRVKRWITEGNSGSVAGAALRYEQSKAKEYAGRME